MDKFKAEDLTQGFILHGLPPETFFTLSNIIRTFIKLIKYIFTLAKYALTRKFQADNLQGKFG